MPVEDERRAASFQAIYAAGGWLGRGSGPGSDPERAEPYVQLVSALLSHTNSTSILDLGCGDWRMWPQGAFDGMNYVGVDVVGSVVQANTQVHGTDRHSFIQADIVKDALPAADLVLCKEVLQHLPNKDITIILRRVQKLGAVVMICDDSAMYSSNRLKRFIRAITRNLSAPHLNVNQVIAPGHARLLAYDQEPFLCENFLKLATYRSRTDDCVTEKTAWIWAADPAMARSIATAVR